MQNKKKNFKYVRKEKTTNFDSQNTKCLEQAEAATAKKTNDRRNTKINNGKVVQSIIIHAN